MAKGGRQANQKKDRYWTGAHTTHKLRYHLVFVPKYRKRVLQGEVAARLEALLRQACAVNRWNLEEMLELGGDAGTWRRCWNLEEMLELGGDAGTWRRLRSSRIMCICWCRCSPSTACPMWSTFSKGERVVLKGGTSRVLRLDFPDLEEHLWGDSFWADGYFAASVGVVEGNVVTEYIRSQRV